MPYELNWRIENRVIWLRVWDVVTMDEINTISPQIMEMLNAGSAPVHLLADYTDVTRMPFSLQHSQKAVDVQAHPHIGWVMTITNNQRMRFITTILLQITSMWMRQFAKVDEALEFLQHVDDSL